METSLVAMLKYFVDYLNNEPSEALYFLPAEVVNTIYFVPLGVIVLSVLRGLGSFLGNFFMSRVGLNVVNTLRKTVFTHMLYMPQSYYDQRNSGELVSLIIYNIEQVTDSVTNAIKIMLRDGSVVIFCLISMITINWKLTLIFFVIAPILGSIIFLASRYFRRKSRSIQSAVGQITHISTESFQGIKLVKSYLGEKYENARFQSAANNNLELSTKYERVKALQTPILHIVIAISLACIFYLIMKIWNGSAADAVEYVGYAGLIAKPFRQLSTVNSIIQRGMAAAETIFATIDSEREKDNGQKTLEQVKGKIVFRNVSFNYNENEQAIRNIDFVIEPGETVALVGSSGSGKSTIASLLLRFYEASSGSITIDGIEINDIQMQNLRHNIALVNQQTTLFNDSVRSNIAYGSDLQNASDEDIKLAAQGAYAKHFIDNLDDGFETNIGEDGGLLSGGQRQRIAIARALLKNAPILILDEATSALDNESEKHIQVDLERLKEGRTTLVIAHRLSTIENADKIIVMQQGEIIEQGNHQELMAKNGAYVKLHNTQINNA